jgi:hypothetical protein
MLQDGLMIGNAPDFVLSLKGEAIFHKVLVTVWRNGLRERSDPLSERALSALRKRVMEIVRAKTYYGKLVPGVSDFGICDVPAKEIKITVNIMWNERLSQESIVGIVEFYNQSFFGAGEVTIKVSGNNSEGGPKSN